MKLENFNAYIFGSALTDPERANDIDVAVTFDYDWPIFEQQLSAARASVAEIVHDRRSASWHKPGRPLDIHFVRTASAFSSPHITLPLPFGRGERRALSLIENGAIQTHTAPIEIGPNQLICELLPEPQRVPLKIEWQPVYTIPAAIRAADTPEELLRFLRQVRGMEPLDGETEIASGQFYAAHIDLGEYHYEPERADWDSYVAGLTALRSAISKSKVWPNRAETGLTAVLNRLALRGPSGIAIREATAHSPGGRARLFCGPNAVFTEYGMMRWAYSIAPYSLCAE